MLSYACFSVWVFFYVWTGVSKSVLGQILCLFLIMKRDSENPLSFMAWFNSSMCSSKTLGWSCHSCVESWSSSGLKWILGHCVSAGLIQNLLDESDLSSYNWDLIFRSIYKAFQWPDCDMYFDRAQLKPCLFIDLETKPPAIYSFIKILAP